MYMIWSSGRRLGPDGIRRCRRLRPRRRPRRLSRCPAHPCGTARGPDSGRFANRNRNTSSSSSSNLLKCARTRTRTARPTTGRPGSGSPRGPARRPGPTRRPACCPRPRPSPPIGKRVDPVAAAAAAVSRVFALTVATKALTPSANRLSAKQYQ